MKARRIILISSVVLLTSCGKSGLIYDASGVFESTEVTVSAKVTGEIKSLQIAEGQEVTAGQSLGQISTVQLELQKSQLLSTKTATASKKLDAMRQVASIQQQISNMQREKERFDALLKDGAATRKQVDDIDYQISVLEKQLAATREQVSTSNTSIDSQTESILAQVSLIDEQIKDAQITSPLTGTVLDKYAEQGEFAMPGKALFKVANLDEMQLRAYVTADQLSRIKLGKDVKVYADFGSKEQREYDGKVVWISNKAEFTPKTILTQDERADLVYAVKIAVKNDGYIKIGMYGEVKL